MLMMREVFFWLKKIRERQEKSSRKKFWFSDCIISLTLYDASRSPLGEISKMCNNAFEIRILSMRCECAPKV
jgi:hypothetical protein